MTLFKKLILSYAVIIIISIGITIIATVRMRNLNKFTLTLTHRTVPVILEEKRAESLFQQLKMSQRKYQIFPEDEFKEFFFKKSEELRDQLHVLTGKLTQETEQKALEDIKKELSAYNALFLYNTHKDKKTRSNQKEINTCEERFMVLLSLLFNATEKNLKEQLDRSSLLQKNTLRFIWVTLGFSVALMIMLAGFFAHYLTYSIRRLQKGARKIAEGDFNYELSIRSQDEVGELTEDFNAMAQKLKNMEETKAHFMAMVLHDLKGPITAMKGTITLMLEKKESLPPHLRASLELTNSEIEHLNRLVDDLNEVSHIDSGIFRLIRMPFSLQELIGELVSSMQPVLKELNQKIELMVDSNISKIKGDRDRIKQVFTNLISNASRFSPVGGIIHVSVEAKSDRAFCQVRDSGTGIPKGQEKIIFEKFQTGEPGLSKRVGSGLGLYIVKKMIDFHGGRIWFQSEEGKGTTFYFTFPYV
ncbi:MAG: HAMP domain-containing sensor histidine kinase [bacterium]